MLAFGQVYKVRGSLLSRPQVDQSLTLEIKKMLYSSATSLVPAFLATIQAASGFSLKPSGQTLELDGIPYYVPPKVVTTISSFGSGRHILQAATDAGGLLPITVVSANSTSYTSSDFSKTVSAYLVEDDVYSAGFLEAVYVQYHAAAHVNGHLNLAPSELNITGAVATTYINNKTAIPGGPYFVSSIGAVYEAWRLYSDIQGAFFETTIGNGDGSYSVLPANVVGQHLAVAVPSRVYFTPTADQPLAGVRLGVKDIFDLKGMRTSNGNRAWYHFYPPANKTALSVQRLIDAGAIVVGKMVTSQFANGETATADWVSLFRRMDLITTLTLRVCRSTTMLHSILVEMATRTHRLLRLDQVPVLVHMIG